jgi:hypothetical protein
MSRFFGPLAVSVFVLPVFLFGQAPQADEASCKDQTWLTRMRDCALVECPASKEFDAVEMPVGTKGPETVTKRLEGETPRLHLFL